MGFAFLAKAGRCGDGQYIDFSGRWHEAVSMLADQSRMSHMLAVLGRVGQRVSLGPDGGLTRLSFVAWPGRLNNKFMCE